MNTSPPHKDLCLFLSRHRKTFLVLATVFCRLLRTQANGGFDKLCMAWGILGLLLIGFLWGFAHPLIPPWLLRRQKPTWLQRYKWCCVLQPLLFLCLVSVLDSVGIPRELRHGIGVFPKHRCRCSRWLGRQDRNEEAKTILSSSFTSAIVESFLRRI